MSLQFSVLASGSSGNAMYVATEKQKLLIDAGLSGKKLIEQFKKINRCPNELDGILVTHEHTDHIKGLGVFAKRYNLPIYGNEKTLQALLKSVKSLRREQLFEFPVESVQTFGDIDVESFGVSHDAVEPMFYSFHYKGKKLTLATDLGYVSDRIKRIIQHSDTFVFEANHDVNMLMMGRYPWHVKRRILSDVGHVSNEDAAYALADVIDHTKQTNIYLAHLSKDNNLKDLARLTIQQILAQQDFVIGDQIELFDTDPNVPTKLAAV